MVRGEQLRDVMKTAYSKEQLQTDLLSPEELDGQDLWREWVETGNQRESCMLKWEEREAGKKAEEAMAALGGNGFRKFGNQYLKMKSV